MYIYKNSYNICMYIIYIHIYIYMYLHSACACHTGTDTSIHLPQEYVSESDTAVFVNWRFRAPLQALGIWVHIRQV